MGMIFMRIFIDISFDFTNMFPMLEVDAMRISVLISSTEKPK